MSYYSYSYLWEGEVVFPAYNPISSLCLELPKYEQMTEILAGCG